MNERRTKIALERIGGSQEMIFRAESRRWLKAHTSELRIGDWGLEATGDLGGYKRGMLRLPWARVAELHYGPADRGAIEGLYAREGEWCSRCVLPWVSESQAEEIIGIIAERHPRLAIGRESALETAVGEAMVHRTHVQRGWLPMPGRRSVAVAAPLARL